MNCTLSLQAKPSLNRDCLCKTLVNQRLFPFSCLLRKNSCYA